MDNQIAYYNNEVKKFLIAILNNKELEYAAHYVGGSLCIDRFLREDDVLLLNLSEENATWFVTGECFKLTADNRKLIFKAYLKCKGKTSYYKKELAMSGLRQLLIEKA